MAGSMQAPSAIDSLLAAAPSTGGPAWWQEKQAAARTRFAENGLPTTKLELWKHTNPAPIGKHEWTPAAAPSSTTVDGILQLLAIPVPEGAPCFVVVNGEIDRSRSTIPAPGSVDGLELRTLRDALADEPDRWASILGGLADTDDAAHAFTALNTAMHQDGVALRWLRNTKAATPVYVIHITLPGAGPSASHNRIVGLAETGSEGSFVEIHAVAENEQPTLTTNVVELAVADNAKLQHVTLQRESDFDHHVAHREATIGRDATYENVTVTFGSALTRNDTNARLQGENGHAKLHGLTILGGKRHADNHTRLDHQVPHCTADERYKHILADKGHAVFYGRIIVAIDAQKTDAIQHNQTLMLSDQAKIDAMPQLEIYADDVKCTHGATCSALDPDHLFYLLSRGVERRRANALLSYAFAAEIIEGLPESIAPLTESLVADVNQTLEGLVAGTPATEA